MLHRLSSRENDLLEQFHSLGVHVVHQVVKGPTGIRQKVCQNNNDACITVAMVEPGYTDMDQSVDIPFEVVPNKVAKALDENLAPGHNHHGLQVVS